MNVRRRSYRKTRAKAIRLKAKVLDLTLGNKWPATNIMVGQQYGYFQKMFAGDIVFFQVGRFFEFYHGASKKIARLLNLYPLKKNRRDARFGFSVRHMIYYLRRALDNGKSVVVVLEGKYLTKIKERKIWRRYERNSVKV